MMKRPIGVAVAIAVLLSLGQITPAPAVTPGAVVGDSGCTTSTLAANDDESSARQTLPFAIDFLGTTYNGLYVNNNGNVSFEQPLLDFTPGRLATASTPIISVFHADVDTRSAGTVSWGTTTFDGRPAFCVNWQDVGYFAAQGDKTNSFQLLLIQREDRGPGSADIIFNYDTITWETGYANGGVQGFGGAPARAGYSAGSGSPGTYFEVPGSGSTRALVDSNVAFGLSKNSYRSDTAGRWAFRSDEVADRVTGYVAMGDSYQSGEGAYQYAEGTNDEQRNTCHRSRVAYPELLRNSHLSLFELTDTFAFVACSGARLSDILRGYQFLDEELETKQLDPSGKAEDQLSALSNRTRLVTIGLGGNDLEWAAILQACIVNPGSCASSESDAYRQAEASLRSLTQDTSQQYILVKPPKQSGRNDAGSIGKNLKRVLSMIGSRAPNADIVVVGYPSFFPTSGGVGANCALMSSAERLWVNSLLNRATTRLCEIVGTFGSRFHFVDNRTTFTGHELCNGDGNDSALHDKIVHLPFVDCIGKLICSESFHPTAFGHVLLANAVENAMQAPRQGIVESVYPDTPMDVLFVSGEHHFPVSLVDRSRTEPPSPRSLEDQSSTTLVVTVTWDGLDDAFATLMSPDGTTYTETQAATVEPGRVVFEIPAAPEGQWRAIVQSPNAPASGIPITIDAFRIEPENLAPVANAAWTVDGKTVIGDARHSFDPDGSIMEYIWDMGDGTTLFGPTITYTYAKAADSYTPTLLVADDRGHMASTTLKSATAATSGVMPPQRPDGDLDLGPSQPPHTVSNQEPPVFGSDAPAKSPYRYRYFVPLKRHLRSVALTKIRNSNEVLLAMSGAGRLSRPDRRRLDTVRRELIQAGMSSSRIWVRDTSRLPQTRSDGHPVLSRVVIFFERRA